MKSVQASAEAGFALIETLIAAAIVATITAVFFQVVAGYARAANTVADRRVATMIAKSAFDAAIGDSEGTIARTGVDGRLQWQVVIDPYQPRVGTAPPLDRVTVTVSSAGSARPILQLRSLRVGR